MLAGPRFKCRSLHLAGALGFYGSHLLYGKQIDEQAAFGRAVGTVWDSLDAKTKERIQAARERQ